MQWDQAFIKKNFMHNVADATLKGVRFTRPFTITKKKNLALTSFGRKILTFKARLNG